MQNSSKTLIVALALFACAAAAVRAQGLQTIIGGQTAAAALASSANGISRYLAPDGPIQPALTAIGGLPLRGVEYANRGISSISSGFGSGAQSLASAAGQPSIRMPGMDALESSMPVSIANLGNMGMGMIRQKNNFIRGQAERGVAAGERLRDMFQGKVSSIARTSSGGHGSSPMVGAANLVGEMQDSMMKGASQIQEHLKEHLGGHLSRVQNMQEMGSNMRNQLQGVSRTLQSGLMGTVEQLQRTGDQMREQLTGGLKQNSKVLTGMMGSMQGSMMNMGNHMQKNVQGVMGMGQRAAHQMTEGLQQALQGPLNMVQSVGNSLMGAKGGHSSSSSSSSSGY